MKRKVLRYYHPDLRKKAEKVEAGEEALILIKEMKKNLREEGGVGLAAPQIGVLKRVVIVSTSGDQMIALLNPKILKESEKKIKVKEGCLSLKGLWLDVERAEEVTVNFLNEKGEELEIKAQGMLSVILQHEIDHLNGKLFIDRVGFIRKIKALASYFFKRK